MTDNLAQDFTFLGVLIAVFLLFILVHKPVMASFHRQTMRFFLARLITTSAFLFAFIAMGMDLMSIQPLAGAAFLGLAAALHAVLMTIAVTYKPPEKWIP